MKKITYITLVFLLIGIFFILNKNNNITLDEVKIKDNKSNVTFAMYIEKSSGDYEISNENDFPLDTHTLNLSKSKCIDNNEQELSNILSYDNINNKVVVDTSYTSFCYLYFDVKELIYTFDYTGSEQTFTVPYTGTYKLETWGAQGGYGRYETTNYGGYGAYSTGIISKLKGDKLYINVAGKGGDATSKVSTSGGYNGGGTGAGTGGANYSYDKYAGGGGGATHIALDSGLLSTLSSHATDNRILIVASGGSGGIYYSSSYSFIGFNGGGYIGIGFQNIATQSTGFQFGQGMNCKGPGGNTSGGCSGGGGGYYGGPRGDSSNGGSGMVSSSGSSYIGNTNLTNKHMTCYNCTTSNVTNTKTISNTCVNANPVADCSKIGNGYAKITYMGN